VKEALLPPGLGAFLWGVVVVLGGGSLFLFRLPGAIRRRRIKRAAAAVLSRGSKRLSLKSQGGP
jgi:hypothetical protein